MANGMESLQTLLRMQSPSNAMIGVDDPFVARRRAEIFSGLDEWLPDADAPEYYGGQQRFGGSRADLRSADMARLKQRLGLGRVQHEQQLEREQQKGAFELETADRQAKAYADRLMLQNALYRDRDEYRQDRLDDRTQFVQGQVGERQASRQTVRTPTDAMEKRLAESRSAYQSPGLIDRLIPGRRESSWTDYVNSLTSALTRMGSLEGLQSDLATLRQTPGASLDERIANAGGDPNDLHPYEREWLELNLR